MPIIAPPPTTFSGPPLSYYQQLQIDLQMIASGPNGEFAAFTLAPVAGASVAPDPTLFAMTGGFVGYYPPNTPIPSPDNYTDPQRGVLMLTTWLGDFEAQTRAFPPDVPATGRIYYVGVDPIETKLILRAEAEKMKEPALRASWKAQQGSAAASNTTPGALVDAHTLRVMTGQGSVFVEGGAAIGKAALDVSAAAQTYAFALRMTDCGNPMNYVSPVPLFSGIPYFVL
jgi:hypothetical protein